MTAPCPIRRRRAAEGTGSWALSEGGRGGGPPSFPAKDGGGGSPAPFPLSSRFPLTARLPPAASPPLRLWEPEGDPWVPLASRRGPPGRCLAVGRSGPVPSRPVPPEGSGKRRSVPEPREGLRRPMASSCLCLPCRPAGLFSSSCGGRGPSDSPRTGSPSPAPPCPVLLARARHAPPGAPSAVTLEGGGGPVRPLSTLWQRSTSTRPQKAAGGHALWDA